MSEDNNSPDIVDVCEARISARLRDVHTCMPARVESYDKANQTVSVQPLVHQGYEDEDGTRKVARHPVITNVPVEFPYGSGGECSMTWPLKKGDLVMLMFSEVSLDRWKSSGREIDPGDDRQFNLSDAVAYPGMHAPGKPMPAASVHDTAMVIRAPEIHAGGTKQLATLDDLNAVVDALTGATPTAGDGGVALLSSFASRLASGPPVGTGILKGG